MRKLWNFRRGELSFRYMAEETPASSRFWQVWALLAGLGTALAGGRLLFPTIATPAHPATQASPHQKSRTSAPVVGSSPIAAPSVDRLLARLAVAATSTERCALPDQLEPSKDPQATYAITGVLENAQLVSVRVCATQALGRQPTSEARSWLVDLAEDPEPAVHGSALDDLATRDDASRRVVVEATHSDDLELRVSAVNALLKAKASEAHAAASLVLPLIEDEGMLFSLIEALGESRDPQVLPALEGLLEHASREGHLQAIRAIGQLGVTNAAERLEGFLEVGSNEEFMATAEALNKLVPARVTDRLRTLLDSQNDERRALALSAMFALKAPDLSSVMRQRLRSGEPSSAYLVLNHLSSAPDPSFEADLVAFAESDDLHVRFMALQALSRLDTPNARTTVKRLSASLGARAELLSVPASEDTDQARERRIRALTSSTEVKPTQLFELAADPAPSSQDALLRYLTSHEIAPGELALIAQSAPASTVRRLLARGVSEGLIQGLARRADPQFADVLRDNARAGSGLGNGALAALVQLGDDSALPELQRLARSDDANDRDLAVQLLSTRTDPAFSDELERLAADPAPQVVNGALHALQGRAPELVARAAERALRDAAPEDRASVLSSFTDLRPSLSRPLLERSLNDADDSVAVQAIQSLSNLQGPEVARRLLAVVNDSRRSEDVRREAAGALLTLGGPLARANRSLLDALSNAETDGQFVCDN